MNRDEKRALVLSTLRLGAALDDRLDVDFMIGALCEATIAEQRAVIVAAVDVVSEATLDVLAGLATSGRHEMERFLAEAATDEDREAVAALDRGAA